MPTVLIGGGTGFIGLHLSKLLKKKGYDVILLSRIRDLNAPLPRYAWNLNTGEIDDEAIIKADCVINLAGAGIADKRWTVSRKKTIIESRVKSMQLLKTAFIKLNKKPKAIIAASATGIYGSQGDDWLDEMAPPREGFLSQSTREWEKSAKELESVGSRLITIRIGIVLSTNGGALPKLVFPQKFRIGSYFSDGKAYYPWIHIDDLCNIFIKSMEDESISGIFNGVAPNPVTNIELTKAIALALNKKILMIPVPAFLLRLGMGEMADVVLTSARVSAEKIKNTGFEFNFPELVPALKDLFSRKI